MFDYNELLSTTDWNQVKKHHPTEIANTLHMKEAVIIACRMLYNKEWNGEIQNYAVELLYAIRKKYSDQWNTCWKLDVLLGLACEITWRYEEKYLAYKNASLKVSPIPPSLLVLLAECYFSPGSPPVSRQEAKSMLLEAIATEKTIESIELIKWICKRDKQWEEVEYWNRFLDEATEKDLHTQNLYPSFLRGLV
ncbi:MAG: hypothetical protein ACRCSV_03025 [Chlamydiales bacterium]